MSAMKLYEQESLVDVALARYGNVESLVLLCQQNGLAIDAEPVAGTELLIDDTIEYKTTGTLYRPKVEVKAKEYVLQENQGLIDAALQHYGSIEALVQMCLDNAQAVDAEPAAGLKLQLSTVNVVNKKLVSYFSKKGIVVAQGYLVEASVVPANALLNEDGTPILNEDGNYILTE